MRKGCNTLFHKVNFFGSEAKLSHKYFLVPQLIRFINSAGREQSVQLRRVISLDSNLTWQPDISRFPWYEHHHPTAE